MVIEKWKLAADFAHYLFELNEVQLVTLRLYEEYQRRHECCGLDAVVERYRSQTTERQRQLARIYANLRGLRDEFMETRDEQRAENAGNTRTGIGMDVSGDREVSGENQ